MPQNMRQRLVQNDLDAFDRLRVRDVSAGFGDAASNFLAEFQSTAASLEPDERIKLVVSRHEGGVELLKAVLADPQANKICSLFWWYEGKEDVNLVLPLLINHCPGLASLEVDFKHHSAFDFVSSVLERPNNKVKVLEMTGHPEGDFTRFFVALGQSQVSALALSHFPKFAQGLHEYLARDLLVRLDVQMNYVQVSSEMMMLLAECTRLTKLKMLRCVFSQPTAFTFPKSITKLELCHCLFVGGFDWSFLASSNVRELDLRSMAGVDGNRLGSALAVQLRAKGLDTLRLDCRDFVNKTLATAGVELGRIKRLEIYSDLNDASIKLIALALQSPDSEMRELVLHYEDNTASSITDHLVSALRHPSCNLAKLRLWIYGPEHEEAVKAVEATFHNRLVLFTLLQGQQVRRKSPCPLRRLPVEMLRLVGKALISFLLVKWPIAPLTALPHVNLFGAEENLRRTWQC